MRSLIYLGIAFTNVCISIPMTKIYGGVGAAFGTAVSLLIGNGLLMNLYYHYKVGLDMKYFWSQIMQIFQALIFPIAAGTFLNLFINLNDMVSFLFCGVLYVFIFCISMWFIGMNQYEKYLISKPIVKCLVKYIHK
jgi:uncharacterized phage infection (PIP) family protein YhgE